MGDEFGRFSSGDYDSQCSQGLKFSGESRDYFANGRLFHLKKWWDKAGRSEPKIILDYGCGTGETTVLLAMIYPSAKVIGCDVSTTFVAHAKQKYSNERISFQLVVDKKLECPPAQLIHTNGVIHHIPLNQRDGVFNMLSRCLAVDGILAVFENNPINPGTRLVMAKIPFDRDAIPVNYWEVKNLMRKAGLRPINVSFLFYFPKLLAFLRPFERCLVKLPLGAQYVVLAKSVILDMK